MNANWSRDPRSWSFVGCRYLPMLGVLNAAWEVGQLPLYTIWSESSPAGIALAVLHCTAGDLLIGAAVLLIVLIATGQSELSCWHWGRIVLLVIVLGTGYTLVSEWISTTLLRWQYSALMPTIEIAEGTIGLSPVLQWLLLPALSLFIARTGMRRS